MIDDSIRLLPYLRMKTVFGACQLATVGRGRVARPAPLSALGPDFPEALPSSIAITIRRAISTDCTVPPTPGGVAKVSKNHTC